MRERRRVPRAAAITLILLLTGGSSVAAAPLRIGTVADGDARYLAQLQEVFESEIRDLTSGEFDVRFPEAKQLHGDWTLESVGASLESLLADEEVDLVLAIGALTGHAAAHHADLSKPVLAPLMLDPALQGLPWSDGTSGVANFSYLAFPADYAGHLKVFGEVFGFERTVLLADERVLTQLPELQQAMLADFADAGIATEVALAGATAESALAALPSGTRTVCLGFLPRLSEREMQRLLDSLVDAKIAAFSFRAREDVERGALASLAPEDTLTRRARLTALQVQSVLLGEDPSSQSVSLLDGGSLVINMRTARAVGAWPSAGVLTEADLLFEDEEGDALQRDLASAVREALESNRDLAAIERFVAAGAQDIKTARAARRPQLDVSLNGLMIDQDRAGRIAPERSLTGNLDLTQVLYSEPINASIDIERHLQLGREQELEELRLDIALRAAQAYLDVLRAQTLLEVQRDDVRLTRSNLELARVRFDVGATAKSDVLRWESELASSRQFVLDAMAQRELARIELNRLLHRPLEEKFATRETDLSDQSILGDVDRLRPYLGDPWRSEIFRDFMTAEGLETAPELERLDEAIAAQDRLVTSRRRAFRSPSVGLSAGFEEELADGGVDFSPELPSESSWSVAVQVGLPLYAGGARASEFAKAREQLEQLRVERVALEERIEQRVRANLRLSFSSFNSIELAGESARAADENLELVTEAYARGAVNIIQLLDAQNAAVTTQEAAANAVHDFLLDYMASQRAAGSFRLLWDPSEHDAWFSELESYYSERGIAPRMR